MPAAESGESMRPGAEEPAARRDFPDHSGLAARRLAAAGSAGAIVLLAAALAGGSWSLAVTAGWDGAAVTFLAWVWSTIAGKTAAETAEWANAEDGSRAAADAILLVAGVASLVAIGLVLVEAGETSGGAKAGLIALAVASVALGWASVHTVFTLRYGRLYYADPAGGIDFHTGDPPDYRDFAYVALTIGMTFQVSDTDLRAKPIRRTAIRHALLSFVFGAVIIAVTINAVGGLLSK
jgi:uncharacterized membrane protein